MNIHVIIWFIRYYPLPTPATYPNGAGTPKKSFLFRVFKETEGTAILTRLFMCEEHLKAVFQLQTLCTHNIVYTQFY